MCITRPAVLAFKVGRCSAISSLFIRSARSEGGLSGTEDHPLSLPELVGGKGEWDCCWFDKGGVHIGQEAARSDISGWSVSWWCWWKGEADTEWRNWCEELLSQTEDPSWQ